MNTERAKWILSAWREDAPVEDAGELRAALRLAEEDASLAAWFAEQVAADARIRAEVSAIQPPDSLEEDLFVALPEKPSEGGEGPSEGEEAPEPKVVPFPPSSESSRARRWTSPFLAIAATLLVVMGIGLLVFDPNPVEAEPLLNQYFDGISEYAENFGPNTAVDDSDSVDSWAQAQQALADWDAPSPEGMPTLVLEAIPVEVYSFSWRGHPVGVTVVEHPVRGRARVFSIRGGIFEDLSELRKDPTTMHRHSPLVLGWLGGEKVHGIVFLGQG